MHEQSVIQTVLARVERVAREAGESGVTGVTLRLGIGLSEPHVREHWLHAARGTLAEGAVLTVLAEDAQHPIGPGGVRVEEVEVGDG